MQPPGKKMLAFEKEPVVLFSLNKYMPLENRKRKKIYPFWEPFKETLNKYTPAENKIRKNKSSAEHLTSIFSPKPEKFLWRIWKVKSSDSSLNLCPINKLGQVTTMEATQLNQKPIIID